MADPAVAPLLTATGIDAFYGSAHVLFGVDIELAPGSVRAILGRNGAGKSTLLRSLVAAVERTGSVGFQGEEITAMPTHEVARRGLVLVPDDRRILTGLTVRENLELGRYAARGRESMAVDELLEVFPTLAALLGRRGNELSGGEQQLLCIARALRGRPVAMLLDEPTEGLAPIIVEQVVTAVRRLRATTGVSIVIAEQNSRVAIDLADTVSILESGHLVFSGTTDEFHADPGLARRYLAV